MKGVAFLLDQKSILSNGHKHRPIMPPTRRSTAAAAAAEDAMDVVEVQQGGESVVKTEYEANSGDKGVKKFCVSWNKILINFQRHFFSLNDGEKTKLHFANAQRVDCMKGSWALLSMVDAMAQLRQPPKLMKIKFNSVRVLILSIEEIFEREFVPDGAEIEVVNEHIEWQDYDNLERVLLKTATGQIRKQQLIHAALEILKNHGTLQENIEYTMRSALEGTNMSGQHDDGGDF